jgi:hypothetical protein
MVQSMIDSLAPTLGLTPARWTHPGPRRGPGRVKRAIKAALFALAGVLIGLDITLAAPFGAGHGETFSHYASRHIETWGGPVCTVLDAFDPDHCRKVTY